jgi:hypothetical protein|tara:strand:+ start:979 stop:1176 length:198 start_codon:yes stop_codon:yes gene_type:complete
MNYQPKKPFFKMNIKELKEYVNECERLDKVAKSKKKYKTRKRKMKNGKTRKRYRKKRTRAVWLKS